MKTLTRMMLVIAMSLGLIGSAFADPAPARDGFQMLHGEMLITRNGKTTAMGTNMKLRNGTEVRTDGLVRPPDADSFRLKEGDFLGFDGTVVKAVAAKT
jgi:hypothetical protein